MQYPKMTTTRIFQRQSHAQGRCDGGPLQGLRDLAPLPGSSTTVAVSAKAKARLNTAEGLRRAADVGGYRGGMGGTMQSQLAIHSHEPCNQPPALEKAGNCWGRLKFHAAGPSEISRTFVALQYTTDIPTLWSPKVTIIHRIYEYLTRYREVPRSN
jgi:hypothetical protein